NQGGGPCRLLLDDLMRLLRRRRRLALRLYSQQNILRALPSKLSMTTSLRKKYNRIKLKITKQNAAQLQAQLGAQLHSQLLPKIDLRNLENKQLLRTCSALKLQIFK
ncbi:hypothetical protein PTTG_09385, partial [Puccinia triticina 1-1 BBBD Race 1]|uniref:Uncharacterized protein n=1 Tax=Puccinia triticina (isolate 1-1 / race 1 (BBBD)) TaxID=630390 RepID=A0A0C4F893_PUCT1